MKVEKNITTGRTAVPQNAQGQLDQFILRAERIAGIGAVVRPVVILAVAAMVVAGALIYYNSRFFQPQGRYLFPALVPIGIAMIAGTAAWLPRRWQFAAPVVWLFALGYVNIIASTEMIPYLQRLPDA
ncbi:MAG: hypothetical protein IIB43_06865 [Candidatus Marinimicrobia bacterium]|nr:hypothetical protein [Candidatus Neomarinimicrobiota bacterium]